MKLNRQQIPPAGYKEAVSLEGGVCICSISILFGLIGMKMGGVNMVNTMLNTAYTLLMETVWYITAIAVVAGALSGVLAEFGVISIANRLISPLMYPLYRLPGASIISVFATYFSDNPAVLTLCDDQRFRGYFKRYQLPALTNLGTAFGMGLIISVFLISLPLADGGSFASAVMIGNVAAVIGSIVSTRLMISRTSRFYGTEQGFENEGGLQMDLIRYRKVREGTRANRLLNALLEGGQSGVKMGVAIIPGVLIICTIVLMLTNGPGEGGIYTGAAYEGVAFFPWLGEKLSFIFVPLFGFSSPAAISVPVTSLGSAGAAISLIPAMVAGGLAHANDIAVFTAMCMCWSGYLSTHVAMMDSLNERRFTGTAIACHTIGGLCAGISANLLYRLWTMLL
ncbi:MAG: hypothetical protein E7244_23920 [Enterocloster citroniae]|nr:hypothetical protein [Enterocloster citroniae]